MRSRAQRRVTTIRLLRALWRYRGRIAAHGARYQVEAATAVRTALELRAAGRISLGAYRIAMRLMIIGIVLCLIAALTTGATIELFAGDWWWLLGAIFVVPAAMLAWFRSIWGAPLDWLDEYADPTRTVPLSELPRRLRELARELRHVADIPANISRDLDDLAGHVERG